MSEEKEKWDLIIKPRVRWFEFNFDEIWRYRDLVMLFVRRDFAAHYTQTVLGPVWHLLQPILTTLIFLVVFSRIANIPTDGIQPILFYMSGITIWNYFSFCLTSISGTFIINAPIFGKVYFPRVILPVSVIVSNMVRFAIQFSLLIVTIAVLYFKGEDVHVTFRLWIWLPVIIALMAGFALGGGLLMASLTAKYRDLNVLLTFAVQLYMYATPIAYPMSHVERSSFAWLIKLNPLSPVVEAFRYSLFGKGTFTPNDILYSIGWVVFLLLTGFVLFNRVEKKSMDTV
jgi:lipopolysaccharide transport system permease protein